MYMYSVPLGGSIPNQNINVGTNLNFGNVSIANASIATATIGELRTNIFSQNTLNVSQINASELNLPSDYIIPFLNVSQLIAFSESFVDLSATNISSSNITATSVIAPNVQPTLTAGNNIDICGNVISSTGVLPSIGNFTEINASTINASNLSTADLSIGSNLTLTNKLLNVNSTANVTQNSADLITSGAVYSALNGTGIGDTRNLTNMEIYNNQSEKPIVIVNTEVFPGQTKNIMQATYFVKFGIDSMVSANIFFPYEVEGFGADKIEARIKVLYETGSVITIAYMEQIWVDGKGGGTRSGTLCPLQGAMKSNTTGSLIIFVEITNRSSESNDAFRVVQSNLASFVVSESLVNDSGSDLNLNTGSIQADEANFNSLSILEGSPAGQANIGRAVIGNDGHSDRMALSINGNTGATNYGFAQVASGQTIMNAQSTSTSNSFRVEDVEVASINYIGLAIGYEDAFFPLTISGDAFIEGIAFISEIDSAYVDATNLSSIDVSLVNLSATKASIDNLSVGNITITGNITANALNLSTGNLVPGANITVENNVISAYLSSDSQANLSSLQVDNNVDVFGVLNVSQTSNFQDSLNVSNNLYVGKSGQHAGDIVLYSGVVGNNFVQSFNSSGYEVNISVTGNSSAINFFVGNQPCLEIRNNGIETLNLQADDIYAETLNVVELEADIFECIDGEATFRFTTPLLNATTANISTLTLDELDLDELDITTINASNGNLSTAFVNQLNASTCILTTITANEITTQSIESINITTSNFATPNANVSSINSSVSRSRSVNTFSFNLSDESSSAQSMTMNRSGGAVNIVNNAGSIIFQTNTNSTERALIMDSNNLIQTRTIQNAGLFESRNISTDENVSVGGSLSVGGSIEGYQETVIAGTNISIVGNTISSYPPSNANFSSINASSANISRLVLDGDGQSSALDVLFTTANFFNAVISNSFQFTGSDCFFGSPTQQPNSTNGGDPRSRINFFSSNASFEMGMRFGVNEANQAQMKLETQFGNVSRFNININNISVLDIDNASTRIHNALSVNTNNNSFLNTSFITCNGAASFGNDVNVTGDITCDELDTDQVYTVNLSSSALDAVNITTDTITSFQYNISDSSDDAEASFLFRNGATTRFIHTGGRLRFECDELQTAGTANFSSLNAEFINSSNVVNVSEIIGADCDFGSGYIQSFKSELINASNMNLSNQLNASVVNASQINASNIVGYQETLVAGTNITITGNTISSAGSGGVLPANVNFSSVNTSTLNTSTIDSSSRVDIGDADGQSHGLVLTGNAPTITLKDTNNRSGMIHMNGGNMFFLSGGANSEVWTQVNGEWPLILNTASNGAQFGGIISAPNQVRFRASRTASTSTNTNVTLPFNKTLENVGGGYSNTTYTFTAPITGTYYFYAQIFTLGDNVFRADFYTGSTRVQRISREGPGSGSGGPTTFVGFFHYTLNQGQTMYMKRADGIVNLPVDPYCAFGGYLLG